MPASDSDDLALIARAAETAGQIALGYFANGPKTWHKAPNDPVSEADMAVNAHLEEVLRAARPDYGWLSEESTDNPDRLSASRLFVVDPIDGTRAFLAEETNWAISIAVVADGQPRAGVVHLPAKSRFYSAAAGAGASRDGTALRASRRDEVEGARLLASRPAMSDKHWRGGIPPVARHFRPSLAYRLCLVAEGRFDAMATFRDSWEWDIAAGALIASEAGAQVSDREGRQMVFNSPRPKTAGILAAGGPALYGGLLAHATGRG